MGEPFVKKPWSGEQESPARGADVCWGGHYCPGVGSCGGAGALVYRFVSCVSYGLF